MYKTIQKRNPIMVVILMLITCGLYSLYWYYKMYEELSSITNQTPTQNSYAVDLFISIITCGLWGFYVDYKISKQLHEIRKKYNLSGDDSSNIILVLDVGSLFTFYFLFLITSAIQQDEWNQILEQISVPLENTTKTQKNINDSSNLNNQNPYF